MKARVHNQKKYGTFVFIFIYFNYNFNVYVNIQEEDKKLSGEELNKKLEKLLKTSESQLQALNTSGHQLRATCYGQDRFWRRYWSLPTAGGIFIEAMESAQPEVYTEQVEQSKMMKEAECMTIDEMKKLLPDDADMPDASADKEVSEIVGQINNNLDSNEHRKTPNREEPQPNEEQPVVKEESHKEDANNVPIKIKTEDIEEQIPSKVVEKAVPKNSNLFEKLGETMEKQNEVKEEIKTEIKMETDDTALTTITMAMATNTTCTVSVLATATTVTTATTAATTTTTNANTNASAAENGDVKWFSILGRDFVSCEGVFMTSGNRWDANTVGVCTRETYGTELKIPVFPPPNCQNSYMSSCTGCDSPGPLQMSAEESSQLDYIKQHGPPPRLDCVPVPPAMRTGWWRVTDVAQFRDALDNMHPRGVRERELKRTIQATMQAMYESSGNVQIEEGNVTATEMSDCPEGGKLLTEATESVADKAGTWNPLVANRVDVSVLEQVICYTIYKYPFALYIYFLG